MSAQEFIYNGLGLTAFILIFIFVVKVGDLLAVLALRHEDDIVRFFLAIGRLLVRFVRFLRVKTQDMNDERVIRSLERDVVATARRMNKVAVR